MGGPAERDCTESQRTRYYEKISGPLLDRIDIQVEVPAVPFKDIVSRTEGESSEDIKRRVVAARKRQLERFKGRKMYANSRMGSKDVKRHCPNRIISISHFFELASYLRRKIYSVLPLLH